MLTRKAPSLGGKHSECATRGSGPEDKGEPYPVARKNEAGLGMMHGFIAQTRRSLPRRKESLVSSLRKPGRESLPTDGSRSGCSRKGGPLDKLGSRLSFS